MALPEKDAPIWACVTLPVVRLFGEVYLSPSIRIPSLGPTTYSRTLLLWPWVFLKGIWPKWQKAFKAIRKAELELNGTYDPDLHMMSFLYLFQLGAVHR